MQVMAKFKGVLELQPGQGRFDGIASAGIGRSLRLIAGLPLADKTQRVRYDQEALDLLQEFFLF